jgi:glycosyltransferase involved in cell wall biosynthesis
LYIPGNAAGNESAVKKTLNNIRKFVVVTASYNNIKYVSDYLESIFSQKCNEKEFILKRVIYYDDCSDDGTGEFVEEYKKKFDPKDKLRVIRNNKRVGAHENIYNAIHSCADDEIVLIVDGDDCLFGNDVLVYLNEVYSDPDVWITYGQFKRYPSNTIGFCKKIPDNIIATNSFRSYRWVTSHLRTFYAWLYKRIKKEDLMVNGKFVQVCGDVAIMYPMLEMAGFHSRFIDKVLYLYNTDNSNSYWHNVRKKKVSFDIAKNISVQLRKRKKYEPLLKSDLA